MINVGEKRMEHFWWGDEECFHTVEWNGQMFNLHDKVTIQTSSGCELTGEIAYIKYVEDNEEQQCIDVLTSPCFIQTAMFEDIQSISPVA